MGRCPVPVRSICNHNNGPQRKFRCSFFSISSCHCKNEPGHPLKIFQKSERKACKPSAPSIKRESGAPNRPRQPFKNILKKVKKKLASPLHFPLIGSLARQISRVSRSKIF